MYKGNEILRLASIKVPINLNKVASDKCNQWNTVKTPKELPDALLKRNKQCFGQAFGTFPTVPPFSEKINWGLSTHTTKLILEGEYDDRELNNTTKLLVFHMKKKTELDSIPEIITKTEWKEKNRNWKESTSTSPSGFHPTHSKALLAEHNLKEDSSEGIQLEKKQAALITWQVKFLNIAITNKYSYKQWQTVVTVMILKTPGDTCIHQL